MSCQHVLVMWSQRHSGRPLFLIDSFHGFQLYKAEAEEVTHESAMVACCLVANHALEAVMQEERPSAPTLGGELERRMFEADPQ